MNILKSIHSIILEEIDIYKKLLQYEEQKRDAIVAFNGDLLYTLSKEQENLLLELEKLEQRRQNMIKNHGGNDNTTLRDFIASIQYDEGSMKKAYELKETIEKFARLHETNKKLIQDNLEFFNVIITSLRKAVTVETGYSPEGLAKRSACGWVLMNTTV